MRCRPSFSLAVFMAISLPVSAQPGDNVKPRTGIAVWDTGRWTSIPLGTTDAVFQGDAVVSNGRIAAMLRQKDAAVEVHAVKPDGRTVKRVRLRLQSSTGELAVSLERVAL